MPSSSSKKTGREQAAAARAAQQQAERRRRTTRLAAIGATIVAVIVAVVIIAVTSGGGSSTSPTPSSTTATVGPEDIPLEQGTLLASASGAATGQTVDGVQCNSDEQVAYHIHAHLSVFVNGQLRPIPLGIGIVTPVLAPSPHGDFASATKCYYWLHVHAQDGVIHIESPTQRTYTLGQFFDEWRQPLSGQQVATAKGAVSAYVNGKVYTGDLRSIPLTAHAVIQLDVGAPTVAPRSVDWSASTL